MATRNIIESDISGKADAATISFGLEGTWYEVDLTTEEKKKLEGVLQDYLKVGRRAAARKDAPKEVPDTTPDQRAEIRDWAVKQGFEINLRGRIPKHVIKAWEEQHHPLW